tara:strand:- start:493 stop:699 length:207 start_codon:yes stop_codon:yes gene_type:complete
MTKRDHGAKRLAGVSSNLEFDEGWVFTMMDNTDVWIDIENTDEHAILDLIIDLTKELERRRQIRETEL